MDEGHVVVDAIDRIHLKDVTAALARESGFPTASKLLQVARHGSGRQVFLVRFHYIPAGGWSPTAPPEPLASRHTRRPAARQLVSGADGPLD